jgi:hypothetical protein
MPVILRNFSYVRYKFSLHFDVVARVGCPSIVILFTLRNSNDLCIKNKASSCSRKNTSAFFLSLIAFRLVAI